MKTVRSIALPARATWQSSELASKLRLKLSRATIRQERSSCAFLSFKTQKSALLTWGGRHSLKEAYDQIVHLHIIMKYMFSPPSSQQGSTQFVV